MTSARQFLVEKPLQAIKFPLVVGGIVGTLAALPDEPMPGPGAIGLLFVFAALGLLVLVASLVRTTTAYVHYRRGDGGEPAVGGPN